MNFCGALCTHLEYFREDKLPQFQENSFLMSHFYKIILSIIMKPGDSDVEWQIGIQDMHLGAFWNYFWKGEGSFKCSN